MKELSPLYIKFQESLSNENFADIDQFQDKDFLEQLSDKEKNDLASLFLRRSHHYLGKDFREKEVASSVDRACLISRTSVSLLIESADLLYQLSLSSKKSYYLHQALELLEEAKRLNESLFSESIRGYWLIAKVILKSFEQYRDETLIVDALAKYEAAERIVNESDPKAGAFFADYAKVKLFLANQSEELTDYKSALDKFKKASDLGENSPSFLVDWSEALYHLGIRLGNPSLLELADKILTPVAASKIDKEAHDSAWILLPLIASDMLFMTGDESYLKKADTLYKEALLLLPHAADLWLGWGWIYLRYGWLKKEVGYVENALTKLTALKVKECSPRRVAALMSMGMAMMGLFLEDYTLLRQSKENLIAFLSYDTSDPSLVSALGFSELSMGLYFSDESYFEKAIQLLKEAQNASPGNFFSLFLLYEAYVAYGVLTRQADRLSRGIDYLKRLIELKPNLALLKLEWGIALFRFEQECGEGMLDEAICKLKEAVEMERSESALFHLALAFMLRGEESDEGRDYEEALTLLEELIEKNPNVVTFHREKAIALSRLGEVANDLELLMRSSEIFEQLARVETENDLLLGEYGYTLLLLYDWSENEEDREAYLRAAERRLISAVTLGNKEALYYLAMLYSLANRLEGALCYLKKAYQEGVFVDFEELQEEEWLRNLTESELYKKYLATEKTRE